MTDNLSIFYEDDVIDYSENVYICKSDYDSHQFIVMALSNDTIWLDVYDDQVLHNMCVFNYTVFPQKYGMKLYMYALNQISLLTNTSISKIQELIVYE